MANEDANLEIKCENMMNIVVESRKRFGKMCVEYEKKISIVENKILNFQIDTFKNFKFKPKRAVPVVEDRDFKDLDDFSVQLVERRKRLEGLKQKIKNTKEVVAQMKADSIGERLREPLTVDMLLTNAKTKIHTK